MRLSLVWILSGCLGSFEVPSGVEADLAAVPDAAVRPALPDLAVTAAAPAAAYYQPDIQRDLDSLGCTSSACHGATASPLITSMPASTAEWLSNYQNIHADCTTLDCLAGGAGSLLLQKPLRGGATHSGTKPFASTDDPIYQRWLAWIGAGAPFSSSPPDLGTPPDLASHPQNDLGTTKPETVTLTFTTSASPSGAGSPYSPKNVVAVWIESANGSFVKTAGRWANTRRTKLVAWIAKAGTADVDAVSGATNANYGTLTAKWDLTARAPLPAPADGTYTIRMELADSNASQPAQNNQGTFTFNRNGTASTQTGLSNGGFSQVSIVYSGR